MTITLEAARKNRRMTQEQAAKKIGVTRDTLSNWERGKCFPNALHIKTIEKVYGVSYNDLVFLGKDYV